MKKMIYILLLLTQHYFAQVGIGEYFPTNLNAKWEYVFNGNSEAYKEVVKCKDDTSYIYYDYKPIPKFYSSFETSVFVAKKDSILLLAKGEYLFDDIIEYWEVPIIFLKSTPDNYQEFGSENGTFGKFIFSIENHHNEFEVLGVVFNDVIEVKSKRGDNPITYDYYAKNIGLIKEELSDGDSRKTILELKKYTIPK